MTTGSHQLFFLGVTTMDKLKTVPPAFWVKVGIAVVGIIVITILLRKLMGVNQFILGGAVFIALGLIFFNWVYHRTEPKFLTPIVDHIAPFFPAAGAYDTKQAGTPIKDDTPAKKK